MSAHDQLIVDQVQQDRRRLVLPQVAEGAYREISADDIRRHFISPGETRDRGVVGAVLHAAHKFWFALVRTHGTGATVSH